MPHRSQARADVRAGAGAYLGAGKKYAKDPACLIGHRQGQTCGQAGRRVCSSVQGRGAGACQAGCAGHARATCMGMCLPQLGKKPSGKKPSSRHGSLAFTIPSHPIPSGPIPSDPIRSHQIPSDPIPSHPIQRVISNIRTLTPHLSQVLEQPGGVLEQRRGAQGA